MGNGHAIVSGLDLVGLNTVYGTFRYALTVTIRGTYQAGGMVSFSAP